MSAPRKILASTTLDETETEIFFTRSGLKADPDAADLLPMTDGWLAKVDAARQKARSVREAQADAEAARMIAKSRLDAACEKFGDDLLLAVGKNRDSARWTAFFTTSVSKFNRQPLNKQISRVMGWLSSKDTVLVAHKTPLDTWSKAADTALKQSAAVGTTRGEVKIAREALADELTKERDTLHDALAARARQQGLPREWPGQFFKKTPNPDHKEEEPEKPETQANGG